jgi:hypothetical protein
MRIEVNSQEIARWQLHRCEILIDTTRLKDSLLFQKLKHEIKKQLKAISRNRHE